MWVAKVMKTGTICSKIQNKIRNKTYEYTDSIAKMLWILIVKPTVTIQILVVLLQEVQNSNSEIKITSITLASTLQMLSRRIVRKSKTKINLRMRIKSNTNHKRTKMELKRKRKMQRTKTLRRKRKSSLNIWSKNLTKRKMQNYLKATKKLNLRKKPNPVAA